MHLNSQETTTDVILPKKEIRREQNESIRDSHRT